MVGDNDEIGRRNEGFRNVRRGIFEKSSTFLLFWGTLKGIANTCKTMLTKPKNT
jgi:hypothetical protein